MSDEQKATISNQESYVLFNPKNANSHRSHYANSRTGCMYKSYVGNDK